MEVVVEGEGRAFLRGNSLWEGMEAGETLVDSVPSECDHGV